jgi:hypothetical protein
MDLTYRIFDFLETYQLELDNVNLGFSCIEEFRTVQFYIGCNDLFFWGCSDAEEITEENFHLLEESFWDLKKIDPGMGYHTILLFSELFCARSRKMRPQGAAYPKDEKFFDLFHACGPERETGLGNPHKPGGYKPTPPIPPSGQKIIEGIKPKPVLGGPERKKSWWNFFKG